MATRKHKKPTSQAIHHAPKKNLSEDDYTLVENFDLSKIEFDRYKNLSTLKQSKINDLLRQRKRLNDFVKDHLQENIEQQFAILVQLFFPSEHSLRYALKTVDDIEENINAHLDKDATLFDKNTTKKNRVKILLDVARSYQGSLETSLSKAKHTVNKTDTLHLLEKKISDLNLIINELNTQITKNEYRLHNYAILDIKDSDLIYFLNKLKMIGVNGFNDKPTKEQSAFYKIGFFRAITSKFNFGSTNIIDTNENTDDAEKPKSRKPKHHK